MAVTKREQEIIDLYEGGASTRAIAGQLGLAEATVKAVVRNLCQGLSDDGPERRAERAMMAFGSKTLLAKIAEARGPAWCDRLVASQQQAAS